MDFSKQFKLSASPQPAGNLLAYFSPLLFLRLFITDAISPAPLPQFYYLFLPAGPCLSLPRRVSLRAPLSAFPSSALRFTPRPRSQVSLSQLAALDSSRPSSSGASYPAASPFSSEDDTDVASVIFSILQKDAR